MVKQISAVGTVKVKLARGSEAAKPVARKHAGWIKMGLVTVMGGAAVGVGAAAGYAAEFTKTMIGS